MNQRCSRLVDQIHTGAQSSTHGKVQGRYDSSMETELHVVQTIGNIRIQCFLTSQPEINYNSQRCLQIKTMNFNLVIFQT